MDDGPSHDRRRQIAREWTERPRSRGVFAVRCAGTGDVWVGSNANLDRHWNQIRFSLNTGGHMNKAMQAAWNLHGADSFAYEILEEVSEDGLTALGLADRIRERERAWRAELNAGAAAA